MCGEVLCRQATRQGALTDQLEQALLQRAGTAAAGQLVMHLHTGGRAAGQVGCLALR